jgi:pimeloyl-ACP methyl ester carboxylesterase
LLELCAELKLTNVILVGHSVSGMVSLLADLIDPTRFRQLIFLSASPRYLDDLTTQYVGGLWSTANCSDLMISKLCVSPSNGTSSLVRRMALVKAIRNGKL